MALKEVELGFIFNLLARQPARCLGVLRTSLAAALVGLAILVALFALASYVALYSGLAQQNASYIISEDTSTLYFIPRSYEHLNVNAEVKAEVLCELQVNLSGLELLIMTPQAFQNFSSGRPFTAIYNYTATGDLFEVPGNVTFGPGNYTVVIYNPHDQELVAYVLAPCEVRPYVGW